MSNFLFQIFIRTPRSPLTSISCPAVSEPAAEAAEVNGPLEADKPREAVRQEAYPLPNGFEWCTIDITDEAALKEMYELLCENYVEDDDNMFRFAYGREFLLWCVGGDGRERGPLR